jgi:hypothetical protein
MIPPPILRLSIWIFLGLAVGLMGVAFVIPLPPVAPAQQAAELMAVFLPGDICDCRDAGHAAVDGPASPR